MMIPNPVDYLIYRGDGALSLLPGKAYGYLLAGNGVLKLMDNGHFRAAIPVLPGPVAGLPAYPPFVTSKVGRFPGEVLGAVLGDARRRASRTLREALYHLKFEEGRVNVCYPRQRSSASRVLYTGGDDPAIVCDLHSHQEMGAFFSAEDNGDEQGCRFYAVIGKIFSAPEICLRVGVYGDFWEVPVTVLFTDGGPFKDVMRET